jgi:hypothetical protein
MLFKKLRKEGTIDQELRDPENMELTVTQQVLNEIYAETRKAPAYRHRVGELVLFYDANPDTQVPAVADAATQKPTFLFKWKAGVVCLQNDEENSPLVEEDLFLEKEKRWAITYSGFKVESFPDPRASDLKERSTDRTYVPLHQIRPFNYWEEVLADIPRDKWHPTINHAMSVMSSISVFDCFYVKGAWPCITTSCRSIWIGAELIYVGDAVRLKPKQQHDQQITDVLVIDSMTVFGNYKLAQFPDKIHLAGRAFTTNANHMDDGFQKRKVSEQILYTKLPPSMFGRAWYYLHEADEKTVVSLDCVVGRLHGDVAMAAWFDKPGNFDIGLHGLIQGREYSRACYGYTGEACWHWAQSRAQQLNLKELNEVSLDVAEEEVEPGELRGHMKVLNRHGVDSSALDDGLADSLPDSQEQLHGASDGASARAILGGRSLGGFVRKQNLESPRSEGRRSEGGEDSGKEAKELIRNTTEGSPDDEADGSEQPSEDELSAPTVKRLKIGHSLA